MDFKTNKPIYQQIVDFCFSKVLTKEWKPEERVVSVRELAALLAVNPHTVLKAYEFLQSEEIIYPKRGNKAYEEICGKSDVGDDRALYTWHLCKDVCISSRIECCSLVLFCIIS